MFIIIIIIFKYTYNIILISAEAEVEERSKRVAAAARRWREYSSRGVDKPPNFKLPEKSLTNKDK